MSGRGSTAPVLTDPAVPTTMHGTSPAAMSASICRRKAATSMRSLASVGIHRIDAVPRPLKVCGLLNPGVRFDRTVHAKPASRNLQRALLAHIPTGFRGARGQEADEVRHVAAADEQSAAIARVADERGDPPHGL